MQLTKEVTVREPKNHESQYPNMNLIEILKIMNIEPDDFVNALVSFIESKSFAKLIKKDQKQKTTGNEKSPYPDLYLHVLINFIMNSEVPVGGYNAIVDQFISGYHGDHKADTWAIRC